MGQCVSNSRSRSNDTGPRYDEVQAESPGNDPKSFPPLTFHTLLSRIKLKRCGVYLIKRQLGLRFDFAGYEEFELKFKSLINETARWEINHLLQFKATQLEMKQKFVNISFVDDQNRSIASLKINLYLLATGPYHQDFAIPLPKAQGARISFNLKIAQMVKLRIKINEVQLIPNMKQFPGDIFAFCLKSIFVDKTEQSSLSYKYLIGLMKDKSETSESTNNQVNSQISKSKIGQLDLRKSTSFKSTVHHTSVKQFDSTNIKWESSISQEMPELQTQIPLYDLHGASFSFVFYSFKDEKQQFLSECFISFNKLANFPEKQERDPSGNIIWQIREAKGQLKTWDHGKQSGKANFKMTFGIQNHIKQMQICVRTENGILQSSPVFGQSSGSIPEELIELEKLSNQIQNLFIQAAKPNRKMPTKLQREKWVQQVNIRLKKQKDILFSSAKQSKLMFVYQDEKSLLKGQRGLIELGIRVRHILDEDNEAISPNCWELLVALIKRGQLTLAYMGYKQTEITECLNNKESEFLKRKKEVSMSYHSLMVDLLQTTLKSLQAYNYQSQRQFAQLFCAYAYFRIPRFRNQVLAAITRPNDPQIEQWRGTQFSLNEDASQSIKDIQNEGKTAFSVMFDWQSHFYRVIDKEEQYSKNQKKLEQIFKSNGWEERMKKRGGAFFAFIKCWINYVQGITINSKHVNWRYFPGYGKLLHSFLVQMKSKKVAEYSQSQRKAAVSLLSNQKLLNPFMMILFKKTNNNEQISVVKTFDLIHLFLSSITNRSRGLPSTFDYKFLLKGMKSVLQGDASFSIGKVLLLVYDNFKIFPIDFRIQVSLYLMSKVFFKLYLHWSGNVRTIFHHLLFIRIYHQSSRPSNQLDLKDQQIFKANPQYRTEVISRYRKLMLILENAQQFQHKLRKDKINNYQKQTYKKMRSKISQRRRQNNNTIQRHPSLNFANQQQYQRQLMTELSVPKLQKYSSQVLTNNLKVAIESAKTTKKQQVIIKAKAKNQQPIGQRKRKLSFFKASFEQQLVPLKQYQIPYIKIALEEFNKISQTFIQHVEKNKESVPIVKLELALDEKELRPEGLSESEEW